MADYKFPTETIELPSKGHFYVEGHPLSTGKVEVKYMTAKEEDILTSQNLIQQGTVIDMLLQSLIVDKSVNLDDLLVGYGKDYKFTIDGSEHEVDLSQLEPYDIDFSKFTKGENKFSFDLPNSKRQIEFKLLTGKDEKQIDLEIKAREKISKQQSSELTTRLKHMILSVDGNSEKSYLNNFIDNEFLSLDSLAFRKYLTSVTPDVDMTTTVVDTNGKEIEVTIPVTLRFFWPSAKI